jgi:hypothetical protein
MTRPPQKPTVTELDGRVHIEINAPNRREAVKALAGQKRRYAKLDTQAALDGMVSSETYLEAPIFTQLQFGDDASYRSVVKSALSLAVASGISAQQCDRALRYLQPDGEFCFGYYYRRDLILNRSSDRVFHCVAIKGDPSTRRLIGYVELFSIYRFVICLSENYTGPLVKNSYSIDPTKGETLELEFDLDFSEEEFRFATDNEDDTTSQAQYAAFNRVMGIALQHNWEREQERVARRAYDKAVEEFKLKPGQEITPEIAWAMSKQITADMLPFLRHRLSAMAIPAGEGPTEEPSTPSE